MQLDLCQQTTKAATTSAASNEAISCRLERLEAVSESMLCNDINALRQVCPPTNVPCKVQEGTESKDSLFLVPDLNLPLDQQGCSSEILYGLKLR